MQPHPLEQYLAECRVAHSTRAATPETAYYSALASLLNAAGKPRDVRVYCVMGLKDQGAGMPDGGLFTPDQFSKAEGKLKPCQVAGPSRGVIECKPPKKDVIDIKDTKQVSDYWNKYNQVLVTNYREFLLVGHDYNGKPVRHEYYQLANSETAFWALANNPKDAVAEHGERLVEFLKRCLRRPAPLTEPKDLAWFRPNRLDAAIIRRTTRGTATTARHR